ncbi:hypothetical protein MD484_g6743, partial [Candolleomyces efflorescens]
MHSNSMHSNPSTLPQAPSAPGPPPFPRGRGSSFGRGIPGRGRGAAIRGHQGMPAARASGQRQPHHVPYPVYTQAPYAGHPYGPTYFYTPPVEGAYQTDGGYPGADGNFALQHPPAVHSYHGLEFFPPAGHEASAYDDSEYDDMYVDDPPAGPSGGA